MKSLVNRIKAVGPVTVADYMREVLTSDLEVSLQSNTNLKSLWFSGFIVSLRNFLLFLVQKTLNSFFILLLHHLVLENCSFYLLSTSTWMKSLCFNFSVVSLTLNDSLCHQRHLKYLLTTKWQCNWQSLWSKSLKMSLNEMYIQYMTLKYRVTQIKICYFKWL